jgi:regulator of sigma E protease
VVIGIPLAAVLFLLGHFFAAACFRRSLFRSPSIWRASWAKKLGVFLAGPLLGYIAAAAAAMPITHAQGDPTLSVDVVPGMAGDRAGLESGDRLISIDGRTLARWEDVPREITSAGERAVVVELERAGHRLSLNVQPEQGKIGVIPRRQPATLPRAAAAALKMPLRVIQATALGLLRVLAPDTAEGISGPVGIVRTAAGSGSRGSLSMLATVALSTGLPIVLFVDAIVFLALSLAFSRVRNPS